MLTVHGVVERLVPHVAVLVPVWYLVPVWPIDFLKELYNLACSLCQFFVKVAQGLFDLQLYLRSVWLRPFLFYLRLYLRYGALSSHQPSGMKDGGSDNILPLRFESSTPRPAIIDHDYCAQDQ